MAAREFWSRFAHVRRSLVVTAVTIAVVGTVPALTQVAAHAAGTGTGVGYTLEGCRASTVAYLPGTFVCPDAQYTTGNLGSGWNELDLVPGRVTVTSGSSSPGPFAFLVSVDRCSDATFPCTATPGYDKLSSLSLNTGPGESTSSCGTPTIGTPTAAGDQLTELFSISNMGTSAKCVYDFYARLAIGSHNYPGASLHYHLKNDSGGTAGIGNRDVSIPVKDIAPFGFSKKETASQGSSVVWTVDKTTESTVAFTNTCADTTGQSVTVTVNWHKNITNGAISVDGAITIGNTAHRPLNIHISDQLYDGTNQSSPDGAPKTKDYLPFAALSSDTYHDMWAQPDINAAASYNDIASGSVKDPVFLDTVNLPNATASASVVTNPPLSGGTAVVSDIESLTDGISNTGTTAASDYTFSVAAPASGTLYTSYDPAHPANGHYTAGNATNGPLTWVSPSEGASGSITFTKTVNVVRPTIETATLHDIATVTGAGGQQPNTSNNLGIPVTAGAKVAIGVAKRTSVALDQDITFNFYAYGQGHGPLPGGDGVSAGSASVTILKGTTGPVTTDPRITGLDPGATYFVDEPAVAPFPPSNFSTSVTLPNCTKDVTITNTAAPTTAQVQKITTSGGATDWTMTLTGVEADHSTPVSDLGGTPGGVSEVLSSANSDPVVANASYFPFQSVLDQDGATYTITETTQTNWDNTDISGDIGAGNPATVDKAVTHSCSIVLDLSTESGNTFECTFTNVNRSDVKVVKTENGQQPTHQIKFELCPGNIGLTCGSNPPNGSLSKTTNQDEGLNPIGTLDFGYQTPGDYTVCELAVPSGTHSTLQDPPYSGSLDGGTGNVCAHIVLAAGSDRTISVNNTTPQGNALTIGYWKHWNSVNVGASSKAGNKLMDTFLPQFLGPYKVDTAQKGVNVLSSPSMKFAENGLAAQLLAAELNVASGALTCPAITDPTTGAIHVANSLLNNINYAGPVGSTVGNKYANRSIWVSTQSILDSYNNNTLC